MQCFPQLVLTREIKISVAHFKKISYFFGSVIAAKLVVNKGSRGIPKLGQNLVILTIQLYSGITWETNKLFENKNVKFIPENREIFETQVYHTGRILSWMTVAHTSMPV